MGENEWTEHEEREIRARRLGSSKALATRVRASLSSHTATNGRRVIREA